MANTEYIDRTSGRYIPKCKIEIFCVSDTDNTNFEIKIAEKIRDMSEYDYDLQEIKFAVSANTFPTYEESQWKEFDIDVELQQTKTALLIFQRKD